MAKKPTQEQTRLDNAKDEKALLNGYLYREDMDLDQVAQRLGLSWKDAYSWLTNQLKQAKNKDNQ